MGDHNIISKAGRKALKSRREPYWYRLEAGGYLGYRKLAEGEGTWIARHRDAEGKQHYNALGTFAGDRAFDDARDAAATWLKGCAAGVVVKGETVADACREYVQHLLHERGKRSARDAEIRFERLVYAKPIGSVRLDRLGISAVRKWLRDQVPAETDDEEAVRCAKDTANRNLASFKAALNLAMKDERAGSDLAWKAVLPFRDVGRRRQCYLTLEQRRALLKALPPDLAIFIQGLMLTPCRPGELAAVTVSDFDRRQRTLRIRKSKTEPRVITLSTDAAIHFEAAARGRIGDAPLFARILETEDGPRLAPWDKDAWKKPIRAAVAAAGLPADTVAYSLRHTAISDLVASGMDILTVARQAGTSVAMIDKHYGHLRHDVVREKLDAVKLA